MIALTWGHESSNFGDEAVTRGCVQLLQQATDDEVSVIRRGTPVPDGAVVAYGGGEHLYSGRRMREYAAPIAAADKGFVLPSTFGPFKDEDNAYVRRIGRHPIAARDPVSAMTMSRLVGRDVPSLADPAVLISDKRPRTGSVRVLAPRREDAGMRLGRMVNKSPVEQTMAWSTYLSRCGADALLVAHSKFDMPLCEQLSSETGTPWVRPGSLDELVEIYRTAGSVVTSRFHGAIFAAMFGKRTDVIGWSEHGHKFTGIPADVPAARKALRAWTRAAWRSL